MNSSDLPGLEWRKSRYSNSQGDCVEVAFLPDGRVALRDSKDAGTGPALLFTPREWAAFTAGVADGEFTAP
jgi:Domain of unknown function (DUF397)